jgi:Zn-dependent protease
VDANEILDPVLTGVVWYAVLLFSLTFHEAAHAWAALRGGDPTAYLGGQVSLDPRPHIQREPLGTVVVPLLFYLTSGWMIGWASTPFDPRWAWAHPRRAGWMSLAGPAANLALVLVAAALVRVGLALGAFQPPEAISFDAVTAASDGRFVAAAGLVSILFSLNLLLCVFNLIPLPPLDGSGALALLLGDDLARRYTALTRQPVFAIGGLLAAWLLIPSVYGRIHLVAIQLLYPGLTYG